MKKIVSAFIFCILLFPAFSTASNRPTERFDYRIMREDVFLMTGGNVFLVQPSSIVSGGNMLYFAGQDFSARRELLIKKTKDISVLVDKEDRKVIKTVFLLGDGRDRVYDEYELVLFLEIRKGFPFLSIMSKFFYTGQGRAECGINWAMDSTHDSYRYYTIPQRGSVNTRALGGRGNRIGQANWIFANQGDGVGGGLIAPATLLGRGDDFIFLNSVPPKKRLSQGESLDLFMLFMPINKNFRILPEIFEQIKEIRWEY